MKSIKITGIKSKYRSMLRDSIFHLLDVGKALFLYLMGAENIVALQTQGRSGERLRRGTV